MKEKNNNRRRYVLLGVLAALALAVGIDRCADEAPDGLQGQSAEEGHVSRPVHADIITDADTASDDCRHIQASLPVSDNHTHIRDRHKVKCAIAYSAAGSSLDTGSNPVQASPAEGTPSGTVSVPPYDSHAGRPQPSGPPAEAAWEPAPTSCNSRFPKTHRFRLGLSAGAGYSRITGLGSIVEDYDTRPTYTIEEKGGFAPQVSLFGTWQYGRAGAELGAGYMRLSGSMTEHKQPQAVTETTRFHSDFIAAQLLFRVYTFPRFYMGAGMSAAIPFGKRNVDFSTDRTGQVYRQQAELTQDHLRETLKTRILFSPTLKLGYADPGNGLEVGLSYGFGISDLLHTRPNDYGYRERRNNVHHLSLTIGYSIPLDKKQ